MLHAPAPAPGSPACCTRRPRHQAALHAARAGPGTRQPCCHPSGAPPDGAAGMQGVGDVLIAHHGCWMGLQGDACSPRLLDGPAGWMRCSPRLLDGPAGCCLLTTAAGWACRVDEMLIDIGDDLTDYEDDVFVNSFNTYRGGWRRHGSRVLGHASMACACGRCGSGWCWCSPPPLPGPPHAAMLMQLSFTFTERKHKLS